MSKSDAALRGLVAEVAAAYFSNSHVSVAEIPRVVSQIAASLALVESGVAEGRAGPRRRAVAGEGRAVNGGLASDVAPQESQARLTSAAEIRRSVRPDGLTSFEDGRSYKTLKRHLSNRGLTPAEYREKWGLPADYPMVCADSSAKRSALAKELGLGQKRPAARAPARRSGARR